MKTKLALLLCFVFNLAIIAQQAQLPVDAENKIHYTGIVKIPIKDSSDLYKDAKEYILLNYINNSYPVLIDEENNRIYVKGLFKVYFKKYYFPIFFNTTTYDLVYTLKLYFKDGRFKYDFVDLFIQRKLNAKASGVYWGYGISTTTIKESEILKYELENLYKVERYRKPFYKLFQTTDKGINIEIEKISNYLMKDNNIKNW